MTTHDTSPAYHPFAHTPVPISPRHGGPLAEMADNPAPGTPEQLMLAVVEKLSGLSDQMRQTQADRRWAEIPEKVWEVGSNPGAQADSPVIAPPMVGDTVFIERALISIPAGATGSLTLGNDTIPNLPAGVYNLHLGKILYAVDVRALTIVGAAGPVWFALAGYQLAPTGSMAP